eukprot:scaffold70954_cov19-Prasinocladus_malaysianus.AAC.1
MPGAIGIVLNESHVGTPLLDHINASRNRCEAALPHCEHAAPRGLMAVIPSRVVHDARLLSSVAGQVQMKSLHFTPWSEGCMFPHGPEISI